MTVQTLVLAQQGDTACIQQLFTYCQRFISKPNSIVKSKKFQYTIEFYPDLSLEDVCQELLDASVDKVINFFDRKLAGNDIEAYIGQAIKYCANDWLNCKHYTTRCAHTIKDGKSQIINHHSIHEINSKLDQDQEMEYSFHLKDSSWVPEQYLIYKDICDRFTKMIVDYITTSKSNSSFGSGLSYKISIEQYFKICQLIFAGEKKKDIASKLDMHLRVISRFSLDILNPLVLLAVDDQGIYEQYLPKLKSKALKLVKNKKGIDFLRSYGL